MALAEAIIKLDGITVRYGPFEALREVTLEIPRGATGLVGRNGAGKSTLMKLLLGLLRPTAGTGRVLTADLAGAGATLRRAVGYMPENDALLPGFRGVEQVALAGELCGLSAREATRRAHESLAYVGLGEARYREVEHYSTGMRQRLKLAIALVHDPSLLLLDEPTVGLDPPGRRKMLDLITDLANRHNKSLLFSTHLLDDIEHCCTTVVIIEGGRVLASGSLTDLPLGKSRRFRLRWEGSAERFEDALRKHGGIEARDEQRRATFGDDNECEAQFAMPADFDTRDFFRIAQDANVRLRALEPKTEDLGELYHRLIGPGARGES